MSSPGSQTTERRASLFGQGGFGRARGRANRSLDELDLSTFNVGGSKKAAPEPVSSGQFEDAGKEHPNDDLGRMEAKVWALQERSAKWTIHLQKLEGKVVGKTSGADGVADGYITIPCSTMDSGWSMLYRALWMLSVLYTVHRALIYQSNTGNISLIPLHPVDGTYHRILHL